MSDLHISDPQELDASIIKVLRGKGYMATPQRIAICRFVLNRKDHPTAQRIYSDVRKAYPTISLATVYKTLQILKEAGMVQELNLPHSRSRFDADTTAHIHLVCLKCGVIRDSDGSAVRGMMEKVAAVEKFVVTGQRLDIYGICQSCIG